ncbi:MAG: branched-chain amino acid ABC transporter permease [Alphaproteobacteria bacterium]|nr:MAG: branched-chain amino acid ABC transporter permease [Alphaproteobacteria bacterium]
MAQRSSLLARTISTPIILIAILLAIAVLAKLVGSGPFSRTIVEMFIRIMLVAGLYIFVGNSGVISFGHMGFMCIGAYAAAWFTIPPMMKTVSLPGLPSFLINAHLPIFVSAALAGLMAAAMLAVINTVYSNWDSVTGGTGSIVGIPFYTGIWTAFSGAVLVVIIAYAYQISRSGLALRAGRDEATAAAASGIDIVRERLIAFVISAFTIGVAGALYGHFLGVVNPDAFYLGVTFITLSMLVVGGMSSLSGAVIGVIVISTIIQLLRWLEKGIDLGSTTLAIPNGLQEITIGLVMIVILMFRPSGLTRNREVVWRYWPFGKKTSANGVAVSKGRA